MALSDFLNGYTSVSLYSRYSLCSHSVLVAQKTVTCCTENYVVTKGNISHRSYAAHQSYASHKKICCGNKKNKKNKMCHPKGRLMLTMFIVAKKRNTSWQKIVPVVYKYMLY